MSTTVIKNYTVAPYYDDFDETKNYHRVLFRPGFAVQARELTQLQTSLQAQIDRHGQYAFKHGSRVVNGKATLNTEYDFIKIDSSFVHSTGGSLNSDTYLSNFVGTTITGSAQGGTSIKAKVLAVVAQNGSEPNTLYIKYLAGAGAARNVSAFVAGEEFTAAGSTIYYGQVETNGTPVGQGSVIDIEEGVYFISGTFVHVAKASLILDKYTNTPSYVVGLSVTESVVDSATDTTLLDNAQGVPNTSAPGATRYKISTALVKESLSSLNSTHAEYITILQVSNGLISVDKTDDTGHTELAKRLATRTFEESGNYAVRPYQLDIKEHLDNGSNFGHLTSGNGGVATKLAIGIEPNVAYVQGYRNENVGSKYLALDKPRGNDAINVDTSANVATPVGNYIVITAGTVKGIPDITNFTTMNLHDAVGQGGSVVGTARARALEKIGTELRLHLFDVKMTTGSLSSVRSFTQSAANNVDFVGNVPTGIRQAVGKSGLIFKVPFNATKTLFNGSASTTEYTIKKDFSTTVGASNTATITIPSGQGKFANLNTSTMVSVTNTLINTNAYSTIVGAPNDGVATLTFNITAANGTAVRISADVEVQGDEKVQKNKQRQNNTVASSVALSNGAYALGKADIIRLVSVVDASSVNVTERFTLDNGQRDDYYDVGRIVQIAGSTPVQGALTITFDYYTHDAGDYFSVDSYPAADYATIGSFNSAQGKIELRDAIDFRPRKADAADNFTATGGSVSGSPDPGHAVSMYIKYYMPRIDKLYVTKEGEFKTATGVPSDNPKAPEAPADAMGIYDLRLNPYIFGLDDVNPKIVNNKRYTMRDIGSLDKRIKNLEYYTSLSLLEQAASNTQLFDGVNPRTKNGFLVDGFKGHNVGDANNPDYQIAIDKSLGTMRPMHNTTKVNLIRKAGDSGAVVKNKSVATLPFSQVAHITQPYSSFAENVNPYNVFSWAGIVKLSPESDTWKDTDVRPDVIINDEGLFDQFAAMAEESGLLGSVWNEWETNWVGEDTETTGGGLNINFAGGIGNEGGFTGGRQMGWGLRNNVTTTTTAVTTNQSRTGLATSIASDTVTRETANKVVEVNFVPFMRSRRVFFKGELLKPNTKVYTFFNNANITAFTNGHSSHSFAEFSDQTSTPTFEGQTQWVTDAFATSSNSGTLVTDSAGTVEGSFIIPRNSALKFKTGTRTFRITDSATNDVANEKTFADTQFHAEGLIESVQKEIISTKVPRFETTELNDSQTLVDTSVRTSVAWVDPLAQSILIDTQGGIFVNSVDLFFKTKAAAIPVRVSIRSMENGMPTQKIVPGSDVIMPAASVNISTTAATSTRFTFDHPVYLSQNQEYCIVIMAQSDDYEVFVAEMGGFDITNTSFRISKQPYGGSFFTSQNASTWTPEQSKDLKFTLNRCAFSGSGGAITFTNGSIPAKLLLPNKLLTTSGSTTVKVFHRNHGMQNTGSPVGIISGATAFNNISAAHLNGTHNLTNVTHDTYTFIAGGAANATGSGGGSAIRATENQQMDVIRTTIGEIAVPGTQIRYFLKPSNEAEVFQTEAEILANTNVVFASPMSVSSDANASAKTCELRCVFTTTNVNLSPMIDLNRTDFNAVQNRVIDNGTGDELSATGGNQLARYITKKVELAEEADKIDVYLGVNKPRSANIDLYWRVVDGGSTVDVTTKAWTVATPTSPSALTINDNPNVFEEIEYSIDPPGSFGTMQFKIVLRSSNSATVPQVKDFRAIAST